MAQPKRILQMAFGAVSPLRARPLALLLLLLGPALLQISPVGALLEERIALPLLFGWRGAMPAPDGVALVTLDEESAIELQLPDLDQLEQWPRAIHRQLIDRLTAAGASAIAMDIAFLQPREPAQDAALAAAMARAGDVVILKLLYGTNTDAGTGHVLWQQPPLPALQQVAEVSTFTLPDRALAHEASLFTATPDGLEATLPVVALQRHLCGDCGQIPALLRELGEDALATRLEELPAARFAGQLRLALHNDTVLGERLTAALSPHRDGATLQTLLAAITAEAVASVNFYGPQGTIPSLPLHRVLQDPPAPEAGILRGRIVFVGLSERMQKQRDYFFTVYSAGGDNRFSGVEVAATLAANLLHRETLRRLPGWQQLLLLIGWNALLCATARMLAPAPWLLLVTAASLGWALLALQLFHHALWIPLALPLALTVPLTALQLWHAWRRSDRAERLARETLGRYVPAELAAGAGSQCRELLDQRRQTDAFCLLTDIVGFTAFSELHDAGTMHQLMNRYYRAIVAVVERHGGTVANIVGDGLLALWPVDASEAGDCSRDVQAQRACMAALDIVDASDAMATRAGESPLTTCAGVHFGSVSLGNLGAGRHYEYAPVGDAINTTARVEAWNRKLGTRVLVTAAVHDALSGFVLRDVGEAALKGKREPLRLYELQRAAAMNQPALRAQVT